MRRGKRTKAMSIMSVTDVENAVADEASRHDAAMALIAARVRRKIVIPACKKLGLRFTAHSGSFWFNSIADDGRVCDLSAEWECDDAGVPELKAVIEVLRVSAGWDTTIGELIESFDPSK